MGYTTARAAASVHEERADWRRFARVLAVTMTGVLLILASVLIVAIYRGAEIRGEVGWDAALYAQIGSHFLATGSSYFPHQFEPYHAAHTVNFYPPTALYLFVPASFAPRILWWVVPLTIIAVSLRRLRPAWWSWPIMAAACVWPLHAPDVPVALVYGNTLMWTIAAMFAAATFRSGFAWAVLAQTDAHVHGAAVGNPILARPRGHGRPLGGYAAALVRLARRHGQSYRRWRLDRAVAGAGDSGDRVGG